MQLHSKRNDRIKQKGFIKEDSATKLAKKYGFEPLNKNIYVNGNHSPGQVFRNCVNPKEGLFILNCAMNIITKQNVNQGDLFL